MQASRKVPDAPGPVRSGRSAITRPARGILSASIALAMAAGPLLDFTIYNPSFAWAAGALTSTIADLARFFRALLGGQLLPRRLLAEMETPNPTSPAPLRETMGLEVLELSSGRLVGHAGDVLAFSNASFSTPDGRRQFGLMRNLNLAPPAVVDAYTQARMGLASQLLEGAA